jgi:hypothetical protein
MTDGPDSEPQVPTDSMMLSALIGNYAAFALALAETNARIVLFAQVEGDEAGCLAAYGYGTDDPNDREAAMFIVQDVMEAIESLCAQLGIELLRTPGGGFGPKREG